mmetsp:Transcript_21603/g.50430  ORF Transcript_21603/g.50430 Transcript_21603/m.50430 type:complete len:221 (+) Transcript_21603:1622-2284(+)
MLGCVKANAIDISIGDPEFHKVGVEFLQLLVSSVVVEHSNIEVSEHSAGAAHTPHLLVREESTSIEELLRSQRWEEILRKLQGTLPRDVATRTALPMRLVHAKNALLMVPGTLLILGLAVTQVVDDDVEDETHSPRVYIRNEVAEFFWRAKVWIGRCGVRRTVSMIRSIMLQERRRPNGVEAHLLNVVQAVPDSLYVSSMPPNRQPRQVAFIPIFLLPGR